MSPFYTEKGGSMLPLLISVLALFSPSTTLAGNKATDALQSLGSDAYVWGYPAVLLQHTRTAMLAETADPKLALNHVFHGRTTPETFFDKFMPVNTENLYSWAWLDLEAEPLLLRLPAIPDRYFSIQLVDAYSNVFQVISSETTLGKAGTFALTSPNWKGELPNGVIRIKATTPEAFLLAQITASAPGDLKEVVKLDSQLQLVPLGDWNRGKHADQAKRATPKKSFQVEKELAGAGTAFFAELFQITQKNPPPTGADGKQLQLFTKRLANVSGTDSGIDKVPIERGMFAGARLIDDRIAQGFGAKVNGWSYQLRAEPFRENYVIRAAVAQTTLFSAPPGEMVHLKATADSEDRQLYGNYKYVLHFKKGELPPTPTSWTLRVYEPANKKISKVPIEKARLNDRTTLLKYNADGSMDIRLQTEPPEKPAEVNWLKLTDEASFFVVLTIYNPHNSVLNRKYVAPSLVRVDEESLPRARVVRTMMAKSCEGACVSFRDGPQSKPRKVTKLEEFDR
jgi:hypothetical protein